MLNRREQIIASIRDMEGYTATEIAPDVWMVKNSKDEVGILSFSQEISEDFPFARPAHFYSVNHHKATTVTSTRVFLFSLKGLMAGVGS